MRLKIILALVALLTANELYAARWKGKTYLYAETAVLKEKDYFESYQVMLNTGVEYIGNPLKSFGCELNIWQFYERGTTSTGIGIRPMTKYYLWRTDGYRVFIEVKGGLIYMTPQFPDGGSQFNFTATVSAGTDLRLSDKTRLMLAGRYTHMSNWNIYGVDNNPTWDGLGIAAGIIWLLH